MIGVSLQFLCLIVYIAGTMRLLQRGDKSKKGKKGVARRTKSVGGYMQQQSGGKVANDCAPISRTIFTFFWGFLVF